MVNQYKIPEGAITSLDKLRRFLAPAIKKEQDVTGYVVITRGFPIYQGGARLLVSRFKIGRVNLDPEKLRGTVFDDLDVAEECITVMCLENFCIGYQPCGNYIFSNYWHAYAFKLRADHEHRNQHGQCGN